MQVSILYEVINMDCNICGLFFVSIVETDVIDWFDGTREIRYLDEVECPHCGQMAQIPR